VGVYQKVTDTASIARLPDEPPVLPVTINRASTLRLDMYVASQGAQEPQPQTAGTTQNPPMSRASSTALPERNQPVPYADNSPTSPETRLPYPAPIDTALEKHPKAGPKSFPPRNSLMSWLSGLRVLRMRVPYGADDERLWTHEQAERGESPVLVEKPELRFSEEALPVDPAAEATWMNPTFASVLTASPEDLNAPGVLRGVHSFQVPVIHTPSGEDEEFNQPRVAPRTRAESSVRRSRASSLSQLSTPEWNISVQPPDSAKSETFPPMPISRVQTFLSFSSDIVSPTSPIAGTAASANVGRASMSLELPPRRFSVNGQDSPVYGLDGVKRPKPVADQPAPSKDRRSFLRISSSSSLASGEGGIEEVLRRQQELDRSIQRLRLGAVSPSAFPGVTTPALYASASSDFSFEHLDQFPRPPWIRRSMNTGSPVSNQSSGYFPPMVATDKSRVEVRRRSSSMNNDLAPPVMPTTRWRKVSVPTTLSSSMDDTEDAQGTRLDSQGTRYEITSFIGGTQPSLP
jgi:hypothetical protein